MRRTLDVRPIVGQVSPKSGNAKTGPIPTTSRGLETCPKSCPFRPDGEMGGCYGTGRIFALAGKYSREHDPDTLVAQIERIPPTRRMLIRDRVVGDIDDGQGGVDVGWLESIADIGRRTGRRVFGYSHHPTVTAADVPDGYTLNASCETTDDVRRAWRRGLPAVIATDDDLSDIDGTRVVTCPAQTRDGVTCATCGLCASAARMADPTAAPVIRFKLHGTAVRKARAAVDARNGR